MLVAPHKLARSNTSSINLSIFPCTDNKYLLFLTITTKCQLTFRTLQQRLELVTALVGILLILTTLQRVVGRNLILFFGVMTKAWCTIG